jgi:hypothetical protein
MESNPFCGAAKHFHALAHVFSNPLTTYELTAIDKAEVTVASESTPPPQKEYYRSPEAMSVLERTKQILLEYHLTPGSDRRGMLGSELGSLLNWGDHLKAKFVQPFFLFTNHDQVWAHQEVFRFFQVCWLACVLTSSERTSKFSLKGRRCISLWFLYRTLSLQVGNTLRTCHLPILIGNAPR